MWFSHHFPKSFPVMFFSSRMDTGCWMLDAWAAPAAGNRRQATIHVHSAAPGLLKRHSRVRLIMQVMVARCG